MVYFTLRTIGTHARRFFFYRIILQFLTWSPYSNVTRGCNFDRGGAGRYENLKTEVWRSTKRKKKNPNDFLHRVCIALEKKSIKMRVGTILYTKSPCCPSRLLFFIGFNAMSDQWMTTRYNITSSTRAFIVKKNKKDKKNTRLGFSFNVSDRWFLPLFFRQFIFSYRDTRANIFIIVHHNTC